MTAEKPWCEQCGERPQDVRLREVGLCEDCAATEFRTALRGITWNRPCGRPLFYAGVLSAICVEPYGSEHEHDWGSRA